MEEELIKKISLAAGRKRISPQTGFIHFWNEDPTSSRQDTIPVLENFIYAYALFRSKTVEHIQEGKALLEKLLAFEVEGNFPTYLHEFPQCRDTRLSSYLLAPISYLLKDFSLVLGEAWVHKLRALLGRIERFIEKQEPGTLHNPRSPEEWAKFCIKLQMKGEEFPHEKVLWNSSLGVFIGECKERWQEGYEPAVTLFDLFMDECPKRALLDHSAHLQAALVHPWKKGPPSQKDPFTVLIEEKQRQCLMLYFGSLERVHSLVLEAKKGTWSIKSFPNEWICTYQYDEQIPQEDDSTEWAFYLDDSKEHTIKIEDEKATLFHAGEKVSILSKGFQISFQVETDPLQGKWTGHISKSDRSFQKSKRLPYGGYDWKLGWRTIQRKQTATATIRIKAEPI